MPWIEQRNTGRLEVRDVTGNDCQTVNQRSRGDQNITFGTPIGNMKASAMLRHGCINGQDTALEARKNPVIDPGAEHLALCGVLSRHQQRAKLDFQYRNCGEKNPLTGILLAQAMTL